MNRRPGFRLWKDGEESPEERRERGAREQRARDQDAAWAAEQRRQIEMARRGMSTVAIVGNLGRDAKLDYTASGSARLRFSVAVSIRERDGEHTDWYRVAFFGSRAEAIAKFMLKGTTVHVVGSLKLREYTTQGSEDRVDLDVKAHDIALLGGGRREDGGNQGSGGYGGNRGGGRQGGGYGGSQRNAGGNQSSGGAPDFPADDFDDDDIPF